ncbi:MAG TPA: BatA domain-containing protein [Opitutaceae bacterium]|nr:BatA domain-containing protein [Opitutaceae bacterium]
MGVLFPTFLAGAAAAALPVVLHLLRRWPRRPVVFPSLRFLSASSRRIESLWQKLKRWLVLLLRCAAFALVAVAFARPFRSGQLVRQSRAVVVVVDNSFSLQAAGRWDLLRAWAVARVGKLEPGDRLGVLLMAPLPAWLVPVTTQTDRPLAELKALGPGWLTAKAEPALRLAAETLEGLPADRREIVLLGDHQRLSWTGADFTRPLPPGIQVDFPDPPAEPARQAALGAPALRPGADGLVASVPVRNFTGPQKRILRVYRDGAAQPLREENLELGRNEARTVVINLPGGEHPARFRFSLDPDDLAADDTAYAVWRPGADGTLLLDPAPAGAEADFVRIALESAAGLKPSLKLAPVPAGEWPSESIAILRNDASFGGGSGLRLNAYLASGGAALVFATGGPAQREWLKAHGLPLTPLASRPGDWEVRDWALADPLVAELGQRRIGVLLGWTFSRGWSFPADAAEPLAHWTDQAAAIGEARIGGGRLVLCGFAPERSGGDWPVMPAFVPFLHQTAAYLFRSRQDALASDQAGRPVTLGAESGKWRAVDGPEAGHAPLDADGSAVPMAPGVYQFTHGGESRFFAINLSPDESDPASWSGGTPWKGLVSTRPPPPPKASREKLAAADAEQQAPLWWWAIAAAGLLILTEMALANRTSR